MITLPILRYVHDGNALHQKEIIDRLAIEFNLIEEERNKRTPSGGQTVIANICGWAVYELKRAGLVTRKNSIVAITEDGKKILEQNPPQIDKKFLLSIPKYQESDNKIKEGKDLQSGELSRDSSSPEDMVRFGYMSIRKSVEYELLEKINDNSPEFFESLVLELVRKMGYGIEHQVRGKSGDHGIDGIIKEDKLGFDNIYFQAKRWKGNVPIHQVRDFAGALTREKSKKGIFITTSDFSNDAYDFVKGGNETIILINGERLARYMYDYGLGVNVEDIYAVKKVDEGYFSE